MAHHPKSYPALPLDPWLVEKARRIEQGESEWDEALGMGESYPGLEALIDEETEFASAVAERIVEVLEKEAT